MRDAHDDDTVKCSAQNCSFAGRCGTVAGYQTCICDSSRTLDDCSGKTATLSPINQTFPDTQYTSWDKYGNDHPIFNDSTIAQIRIEMNVCSHARSRYPSLSKRIDVSEDLVVDCFYPARGSQVLFRSSESLCRCLQGWFSINRFIDGAIAYTHVQSPLCDTHTACQVLVLQRYRDKDS